jgi:hypothetical protein
MESYGPKDVKIKVPDQIELKWYGDRDRTFNAGYFEWKDGVRSYEFYRLREVPVKDPTLWERFKQWLDS